jgi:ribonucleoside-diphosphate reductase alpha chain
MKSKIQIYDGMSTDDIDSIEIKACADLISEESPDYSIMAGRLLITAIRKKVYGSFTPWKLLDVVKANIAKGLYDPEILTYYTEEEWAKIDKMIDHSRDLSLHYAAVKQIEDKYLIQDRTTKTIVESPQISYILVAAIKFYRYPAETRLTYVKNHYDALSTHLVSIPTPLFAGVRSPTRQYSSCTKISSDDDLDSIFASATAIGLYASRRAGIGIDATRIRPLGAKVRGGETRHTGVLPFYKLFQAALKSCSQGGIRGASATLAALGWHYEAEDIMTFKNNKGIEDNRCRRIDYSLQFNGFMYRRYLEDGDLTLFDPHEVPDLYEAFYKEDQTEFEELYVKYENTPGIMKKTVKAKEFFEKFVTERFETGRNYVMNVDEVNRHTPFRDPITTSNLCQEIALPTRHFKNVRDEDGWIALCTLSAINAAKVVTFKDGKWSIDHEKMRFATEMAVRGLDELLDYQEYPVKAAEIHSMMFRPLGVGVINLGYVFAKAGVKYSDGSALELTHAFFESLQFHLMSASVQLAKEKGPCPGFSRLKLADGILPIDTYKKTVDTLGDFKLTLDWEGLRNDIFVYGVRNATTSALMPSESSSVVSNATNAFEPIVDPVSVKVSKTGVITQVVPELKKLRGKYEPRWSMKSCRGYLEIVAVAQKFIDQAISCNTFYNVMNYPGGIVPMEELMDDILYAKFLGIKTLYYNLTNDGRKTGNEDESDKKENKEVIVEPTEEVGCDSGACAI